MVEVSSLRSVTPSVSDMHNYAKSTAWWDSVLCCQLYTYILKYFLFSTETVCKNISRGVGLSIWPVAMDTVILLIHTLLIRTEISQPGMNLRTWSHVVVYLRCVTPSPRAAHW